MLAMTRRPGDAILIGADIVVRVLEVKGGTVRLGIDAPRDIPVRAEEPGPKQPEVPKK